MKTTNCSPSVDTQRRPKQCFRAAQAFCFQGKAYKRGFTVKAPFGPEVEALMNAGKIVRPIAS